MALSLTPPSSNENEKSSTSPSQPSNVSNNIPLQPMRQGLPTSPVKPTEQAKPATGLPVQPAKVGGLSSEPPKVHIPMAEQGRDLDNDEEYLNRQAFVKNVDFTKDAKSYQSLGKITAEDIITLDYDTHYKRLEPKVVEVKEWLQDYLSQQNKTEEVAIAKKERGQKFTDVKLLLDTLLLRYFSQNSIVSNEDAGKVSSLVINEILGLGPIEPLWQDSRITEIMVNGPYETRVEIGGKIRIAKGVKFRSTDHLLETVQQILAPLGRTLDVAHPFEDGRLQDGSRINATHPIIGPGGPYLTIRRFPETVFSLRKLIEMGSMTEEMAEEIGNLIYHRCSTIVSGGTGSGKTSMLNALSGCVPNDERIITIEDNLELRLHPDRHVVSMETRRLLQGGEKKNGDVNIRDLVKNSLRQRPERIIVGEVRDGAAYDMLQAMNTGHEGSMTTIHANDAYGALERLSNLIAQVGELSSNQALSLISSGVDIIVSIARYEDGSRRVSTISEIPSRVNVSQSGYISLEPRILWEFIQSGEDEDGKVLGSYEKQNEPSESFMKKHRLDKKRRIPIKELLELSDWDGTL